MTTNLSIKKKLLIYSFFIQVIVLVIFSFSIYKALEISTLDRYQATLKVILLDIVDDLKEKNNIVDNELDEEKEYNFEPLYIRILDNKDNTKIIQTSNFPNDLHSDNTYLDSLKDGVINFQEQDIYLVSRIKINFNASLKIIVEIATTKDMLWTTLENLLYILFFIVPIVLIFAVIGGNFLIYKSFSPITENIKIIGTIKLKI